MSRLKNLKQIVEIVNSTETEVKLKHRAVDISKHTLWTFFEEESDSNLRIENVIAGLFGDRSLLTELLDEELISLLSIVELEKDQIKKVNSYIEKSLPDSRKEKSFDDQLTNVMRFIQKIAYDVEEGGIDTMKGYIALKKIAKALKKSEDKTKDLAYDSFDNYDKNNLPFGCAGSITTTTVIDYNSDDQCKKIDEELKARKDTLKMVVENNKKDISTNDSEGMLIEVPAFKFRSALVIKKV